MGKALQYQAGCVQQRSQCTGEVFLEEQFCPTIQAELSQELGCETNIYIDEKAKQTVIFAYPHLFTNPSTLQVIRLEIGAPTGMLAKHTVSLYDI